MWRHFIFQTNTLNLKEHLSLQNVIMLYVCIVDAGLYFKTLSKLYK